MSDQVCCGTTCNREERDKDLMIDGAASFADFLLEGGECDADDKMQLVSLMFEWMETLK